MIRGESKRDQVCIAKVYEAGQDHVFRFWPKLTEAERRNLLDQLKGIDFQQLARMARLLHDPASRSLQPLEPIAGIELPRDQEQRRRRVEAREIGQSLLEAGRVGVVMVAGGQGSRLGFDGPKGCFPIGPLSGCSLYQVLVQKIVARGKAVRRALSLYVMTSPATDATTQGYFEEHRRFGLSTRDVRFFAQGMLPALDKRGKLLLEAPDRVFVNPNGHGGVLSALQHSGALEDMRQRGIDRIFYFQVDNPLVDVCDPVFLGFHELEDAEVSTKYVAKTDPREKVGLICAQDGRPGVVEYMDVSETLREARDPDGRLRLRCGNIAVHVFNRDFLEGFLASERELPLHPSFKAIPQVDAEGRTVAPSAPNGYKFESFVFDVLAQARRCALLEVDRAEEFAPVKNGEGVDSPLTARRAWSRLHASWLAGVGLDLPRDGSGDPLNPVEIEPLFAVDRETLAARVRRDGPPALDSRAGVWIKG